MISLTLLSWSKDWSELQLRLADKAEELEPERTECCERCLGGLKADDRDMILQYYAEERQAKIDHRKLCLEPNASLLLMSAPQDVVYCAQKVYLIQIQIFNRSSSLRTLRG